jgi:Xaa-Pro dipeptidase
LQGLCDGIEPTGTTERAERLRRALEVMLNEGTEALVLEPGVDMRYLTGVMWGLSERPFLMVLERNGRATWIAPAFEEGTAREQLGDGARLLTWDEHQSPYSRLEDVISRGRGRVALGPAMRWFVAQGIAHAVDERRIARGIDVVGRCRLIKSPEEQARLRRANEATKAALAWVQEHIEVGMAEPTVKNLVIRAQKAAGLTDVWALVLFGPNAAYPHGTRTERRLTERDVVLIDTGGSLHGYRSDITRTWLGQAATDEAHRAWETVRRAQQAAMAEIRPQARCSEPEAAARAVIVEAGWGPDYRFFTHRLGHGIGLQVHEPPYLVRDNLRLLEPGMTMSIEPGIYVRGQFGVRLEDIVLVTEAGREVFGREPEPPGRGI